MTVTMERIERPVPAPGVATAALARAEARRMWHSPYYWIGLILSVALSVVWSWTRMPTWETFHENIGMGSLILAANLLLATHLAAGRDHRAGAEEATRTMPADPGRRSLALLVTVPIAAVTGAVVYLAALLLLLPTWPVGQFDPWAALIATVIPAIGAAIGVAVGRLLPGVAVGPLTMVALVVVLFILLAAGMEMGRIQNHLFPVPFDMLDFGMVYPFGWHLLYLLGLLAVAIAAVCRPAVPKTSAVVAVVAVLFAGFAVQREADGVPDVIDSRVSVLAVAPEKLDCRTYEGVRYCALPGFGDWIEHWREAVEPAAELLPAAADRPSVRQIANSFDGEPMTPGHPEMIIGDTWGRMGVWAEDSRERMVRDYVATSVGILRRTDAGRWVSCDGAGQHRTVVAMWLLALATPEKDLAVPRIRYGQAETQAAETLLAKPREEVSRYLAEHWIEVLDPSASALAGLGVTITPPPIPVEPETPQDGQLFNPERGVCP
ncbi:hypothetical protein [Actinoplanes derwentensis]|uniref:ABC-type transport system involved in multi-copper enzyme maturation, permease component n=1 Tax=Actinoplanes derwentensis TaxID=113562 RepID=A0A1H2CTF2_9ACTN|nr:hypothetical protein [Actinoplanes derwentensis]GID90160.1 hypothetical protein Ade03nite_90840 [Actinoplanes derwentensis]SDT73557.1 hypothetical protein SAMN04489716_6706 [Actinoplanes derwentensis]